MADVKENKEKLPLKQSQQEIKRLGWGVRHVQAACMCLCVTALLMVRSSLGVAILAMTDHTRINSTITVYEWDKKTQGIVLSSFFWGYVAMQVPAGVLAKRFGGKLILLVALVANGGICLLIPFLASLGGWPLVCAARVATGLTQACTFPATHTLVGRWLPEQERVMLSSFVYGGLQLGTILGMPFSGLLAATSMGWPLVFYTMAGLTFLVALLWHWLTASSPAEHRLISSEEREYIENGLSTSDSGRRVRTPWRHILRSRAVWAMVAANIGTAYMFVMFFVDIPTYLEKGLHISLKKSAALSAVPYIGMWVGGIMAGAVCERIYNKGMLSAVGCRKVFNSIGMFGVAIGLVGMGYVDPDSPTLAMVWLIAAVTISGFVLAGFMMNHLDLSPNFAGVLMSLTNFIANFGSVIAPLVTGYVLKNDPTDLSRWRIVFLITAGICVVSNATYVLLGTSDRQPWDDPDFLDKQLADPEEMKPVWSGHKDNKLEKEKEALVSAETRSAEATATARDQTD